MKQTIGIKNSKLVKNCATSATTSTTSAKYEMWAITGGKVHSVLKINELATDGFVNVKPVRPLVSLLNMTERRLLLAMVDNKTDKVNIEEGNDVLMLDKRPRKMWFSSFDLPEGLQIG